MRTFQKHAFEFLKILTFFWLIAAVAIGIGAKRANELDLYFYKLIQVWDLVLFAASLTMAGEYLYRYVVRKFDLK